MPIPPPPGVPRPSSAWVGGETLCQPESLSTPPTSKILATRSFHKPTICTPNASEFPQPAIIETAEKISKGRPATLRSGPFPLRFSSYRNLKMPAPIAQLEPSHPASGSSTTNRISITYRISRLESETCLQSRPAPCKIRNLRHYASRIRNLPSPRTQLRSESISSSIALWNQYFDPKPRNHQPNQINNLPTPVPFSTQTRASALPNRPRRRHRPCHESLGSFRCLHRPIPKYQPGQQRRRKSTACPMGRGCLNPLPWQPPPLPVRQSYIVIRRLQVSPCHHQVQSRIRSRQSLSRCLGLRPVPDRQARQLCKFFGVGRQPASQRNQSLPKPGHPFRRQKLSPRARPKYRIKNNIWPIRS